jgi:Flp pilus assembly protein TadG
MELAILCPFLLFLFVITIDFARIFYYQAALENCARNGALYASSLKSYDETDWVNLSNDTKSATIQDGSDLSPALTTNMVNVSTGKGSDGNNNVTVTITYPFTMITPMPSITTSYTLNATVNMRSAP